MSEYTIPLNVISKIIVEALPPDSLGNTGEKKRIFFLIIPFCLF